MKHNDYPALTFTCQGGPLDGQMFGFRKAPYVRGGPTPDIEEVIRNGISISSFRERHGQKVPIAGRYRVVFNPAEETYTATHLPGEGDVYFPEPQGMLAARPSEAATGSES